jgi:broad specificity phosphatase PhoE
MTLLYLVRHGRASVGWDGDDPDPGLDELGREQARLVAAELAPLGPLALVTSPLRRARETAMPFENEWSIEAIVDGHVGEIPSPAEIANGDRVAWLRGAMSGTWADLGERYAVWRDSVVTWLAARSVDTVVTSHFIAINAAIGSAIGDDRVVIASLDNASVTVVEVVDGALVLRSIGREADTLIR